jgi:hypothetical protein
VIHDPHLARCLLRLEDSKLRFEDLAESVTPRQATWKPATAKWSVAECIEHLNVSLRLYLPAMQRELGTARAGGLTGTGPWKRGTFPGRLILWGLDPEASRSIPAPRSFRPDNSTAVDFSLVCDRFHRGIDRLVQLASEADGLALDQIRLPTPICRLFRITLAEAFEIHARHIPRHLGQAERVARAPGYPD